MPFNSPTNNPTSDNQPPERHEEAPVEGVIAVPYERLSADALEAIVEEFVTREGTDYGDYTHSLADKVEQVLEQIKQGKALVLFDPVSESCHIELTRTVGQQSML